MRAIYFDNGLTYRTDFPEPKLVEGDALIRVSYAGVCATDIEITKGYMGFTGIPGHEFSGLVERCPSDSGLEGKRVVGEINVGCNTCALCKAGLENHCKERTVLGILGLNGSFAERLVLPVGNLHVIPDTLSDIDAVFTEPLGAAFEVLEQVDVGPNTNVAVLGDGRLGLLIAQVLANTGCQVKLFGRYGEKLAMAEDLSISTSMKAEGFEGSFDIVVDATGSGGGLSSALELVKPRGTVVLKSTVANRSTVDLNRAVIDEVTIVGSRCGPFAPAIEALDNCTVIVEPLIEKIYPLESCVQALEHAGRKGALKVLIEVG